MKMNNIQEFVNKSNKNAKDVKHLFMNCSSMIDKIHKIEDQFRNNKDFATQLAQLLNSIIDADIMLKKIHDPNALANSRWDEFNQLMEKDEMAKEKWDELKVLLRLEHG